MILVGANSTCTLVFLILLRFENVDNVFDKVPDVGVMLGAIIDEDIFNFSLSFGLSTLRRETEPRGLEWLLFVEHWLALLSGVMLLLLDVNEIPCSFVANTVACSSSSKLPSYSRISSVTYNVNIRACHITQYPSDCTISY